MAYTLGEAARATGKQKSTILNALKNGRISGQKNDIGQWQIEPSELHRVYKPVVVNGSLGVSSERSETPVKTMVLEAKIEALREQLQRERELNSDLQKDRDHWREQASALLLTDGNTRTGNKRFARAWAVLTGKT